MFLPARALEICRERTVPAHLDTGSPWHSAVGLHGLCWEGVWASAKPRARTCQHHQHGWHSNNNLHLAELWAGRFGGCYSLFSRLVLFNKGGGSGSNSSLICRVKMTPAISNLGWPVPAGLLGAQEGMGLLAWPLNCLPDGRPGFLLSRPRVTGDPLLLAL